MKIKKQTPWSQNSFQHEEHSNYYNVMYTLKNN